MTPRPHDVSDLYLSPLVLELDRRLQTLSDQTSGQLDEFVALATDREPRDQNGRRLWLLQGVSHLVELHSWEVAWDPRGLRVSHGEHSIVLGVPGSVREYLGL